MAIWRSVLLETLLGGELDENGLTEAALRSLCEAAVPENEQLEFKGESAYEPQPKDRSISWRHEQEFAKDVSAFANHRGGVILIGVEEADGVAAGVAVGARLAPEVEHRRLAQALHQYTSPAVRAAYITVPVGHGIKGDSEGDPEGYATAVVVPPSDEAPHGIAFAPRTERRPLCFPVRDGAHTRFLVEAELADRYQRRFLGAAAREAREQRVVAEGRVAIGHHGQAWCYLAVVPAVTADATMNRDVATQFAGWLQHFGFSSPLGTTAGLAGRPIPAPGRLTFTEHPYRVEEDPTLPRGEYLELHADGAFFGARELRLESRCGVHERAIADAMVLLVEVGLRWAAERVGRWGSATLIGGLTQPDAEQPLELWDVRYNEWRRVPSTRRVNSPSAYTTADLSVCDTVGDRLVSAYEIGSRLVQHFGFAELRQLTPGGAVNLDTWSGMHQQVTSWAEHFGVETANSTIRRSPYLPGGQESPTADRLAPDQS